MFISNRCDEIQALTDTAKSKRDRVKAEAMKTQHLNLVKACRDDYENRKCEARDHPDNVLFVEADSMDQNKTSLPHYARRSADVMDAALVHYHVTCVNVPGHGIWEWVYNDNLLHDSNTTVTVVHR